jgi:hypothetical protein
MKRTYLLRSSGVGKIGRTPLGMCLSMVRSSDSSIITTLVPFRLRYRPKSHKCRMDQTPSLFAP